MIPLYPYHWYNTLCKLTYKHLHIDKNKQMKMERSKSCHTQERLRKYCKALKRIANGEMKTNTIMNRYVNRAKRRTRVLSTPISMPKEKNPTNAKIRQAIMIRPPMLIADLYEEKMPGVSVPWPSLDPA